MADTQKMNLYQKLAKIRAIADAVRKTKAGHNYTYADISDILAKITAGMQKYNVSLIPGITPGTTVINQVVSVNTKLDKAGKSYDKTTTEMLVKADMKFTWVNDENPSETIEVPWSLTGSQSDPSQAFGSGLTYCTRYFLTNYFQMAQLNTDVDAYRSKQKEAEESEDKAIAKAIVDNIYKLVQEYIGNDDSKKADVVKFMKKYVKDSNYLKITDPTLAAKVLEDFTNTYINKESK